MHDRQMEHRRKLRTVRRKLDSPSRRPALRWLLWSLLLFAAVGMGYLLYRPMTEAEAAHVPLAAGVAEISVEVDALLVRNESVYLSPVAGNVHRMVAEGQRVRVGDTVVEVGSGGSTPSDSSTERRAAGTAPGRLMAEIDAITERIFALAVAQAEAADRGDPDEVERIQAEMDGLAQRQSELAMEAGRRQPVQTPALSSPGRGAVPVSAEAAGVLVYQVDGLEGALPTGAGDWTRSWFKSLVPDLHKIGEGFVAQGEPLFKVVDNLSPGILAVIPEEQLPDGTAAGRVHVRFPGRDWRPVKASVVRYETEGGEVLLHLQAPILPDELTWLRRVRVTLVFAAFEGMIVPRSAIDVRDGRQGVWVQDGRQTLFWPVRVLGGNESDLALETDLPVGTPILRIPPPQMR